MTETVMTETEMTALLLRLIDAPHERPVLYVDAKTGAIGIGAEATAEGQPFETRADLLEALLLADGRTPLRTDDLTEEDRQALEHHVESFLDQYVSDIDEARDSYDDADFEDV